jgi:hypothetical protein
VKNDAWGSANITNYHPSFEVLTSAQHVGKALGLAPSAQGTDVAMHPATTSHNAGLIRDEMRARQHELQDQLRAADAD